MSVTESKAKATVKTSKKSVNPAEAAALKKLAVRFVHDIHQ